MIGGSGCSKEQKKQVEERSTRVTLEPLQKRIFRRQIPVQGTVWPVEYATISAKISGTLELLKVDEGDVRKKDDVLFGIDRQVLKNQVTMREDEITVKNAELESARIALESAKISERKSAPGRASFGHGNREKAWCEKQFSVRLGEAVSGRRRRCPGAKERKPVRSVAHEQNTE